jgi:hypothetical protein
VKLELRALLKEVETMRDTNQVADDWEKRMKEVRNRFENDESLPRKVRMVPVAILSLGQNYIWRNEEGLDDQTRSVIDANIEMDLKAIEAGLNWKGDD